MAICDQWRLWQALGANVAKFCMWPFCAEIIIPKTTLDILTFTDDNMEI